MGVQHDITQLLGAWRQGDSGALEALTPIVYEELRRLASRSMRGEGPGHTLQPTAVVNEAYLRLVDAQVEVTDRRHFYALAARMMRRVLVDYARAKRSEKRGGGQPTGTLDTSILGQDHARATDVLELDDALARLGERDATLVQALELIYFAGMSYAETAAHLGRSRTSLVEDLQFAKAWLRRAMSAPGGESLQDG